MEYNVKTFFKKNLKKKTATLEGSSQPRQLQLRATQN